MALRRSCVIFLLWPGITIATAVVLFAIYCFMDAFAANVLPRSPHEGGANQRIEDWRASIAKPKAKAKSKAKAKRSR